MNASYGSTTDCENLLKVDYTGRLFREGKAAISREVAAIFDRIGTTAQTGTHGSKN
ncbi:MAG: hypothetical protein ACLQIB_27425 [Isosphaeraceae bacterium]